jgi:adenylate cyclase
MGREIERKFLVSGDAWRELVTRSDTIRQGYLSSTGGVTVRIRTINDRKGFITIKSGGSAIERAEYEYEIPIEDARELLMRCPGRLIEKRRHHLGLEGGEWVVDEFAGRHAGLILLEVELPSAAASIDLPDWLGEEVSGKAEYYNSTLAALAPGGEI